MQDEEAVDQDSLEKIFLKALYKKGLRAKHMQAIWDNGMKAEVAVLGIIGAANGNKIIIRRPAEEGFKKKLIFILEHFLRTRSQITRGELLGPQRNKKVAFARQELAYLLREVTAGSLPQIGFFLGSRDHTTIIHATKRIAERMEANPELKERLTAEVAELQRRLEDKEETT